MSKCLTVEMLVEMCIGMHISAVVVAAFVVASLSMYNPLNPVMKVSATGLHLVFCKDVDPLSSYSFS